MHIPYHGEVLTGRVSYQPSSFAASNLFCSRKRKQRLMAVGQQGTKAAIQAEPRLVWLLYLFTTQKMNSPALSIK